MCDDYPFENDIDTSTLNFIEVKEKEMERFEVIDILFIIIDAFDGFI